MDLFRYTLIITNIENKSMLYAQAMLYIQIVLQVVIARALMGINHWER